MSNMQYPSILSMYFTSGVVDTTAAAGTTDAYVETTANPTSGVADTTAAAGMPMQNK